MQKKKARTREKDFLRTKFVRWTFRSRNWEPRNDNAARIASILDKCSSNSTKYIHHEYIQSQVQQEASATSTNAGFVHSQARFNMRQNGDIIRKNILMFSFNTKSISSLNLPIQSSQQARKRGVRTNRSGLQLWQHLRFHDRTRCVKWREKFQLHPIIVTQLVRQQVF